MPAKNFFDLFPNVLCVTVSDPYQEDLAADVDMLDDLEELEDPSSIGYHLPHRIVTDRTNPLESMRSSDFR